MYLNWWLNLITVYYGGKLWIYAKYLQIYGNIIKHYGFTVEYYIDDSYPRTGSHGFLN